MTSRIRTACAAVLAAALAGCASPRPGSDAIAVSPELARSASRFRKEYVLAPGDQVDVVVRRTPEVSRTVVVRPDGMITLPIAKEVAAAGLTTRELEAKVTEALSARLVAPEVTVIAAQVRQPVVYVVGDVTTPTTVPLRDAPTAAQAISLAGGFRRTADAKETVLIRLGADGYLRALATRAVPSGQPGPYMALRTVLLQPDDVLFVPESGRSQVARILDDFVNRPLSGVSAILATYANFRFAQELDRQK